MISNGGAIDPHVNPIPMSPARNAGTPPTKTDAEPAKKATPMLGSGTGGAGGTKLGG